MKKSLFILVSLVILLSSCGENLEKKLLNTYWLEPEDEEILLFEEEGVVYEVVYEEKDKYELEEDQLIIGISGWGSDPWTIKEITREELILLDDDGDEWKLKKAQEGDFLLGEWGGIMNGRSIWLDFYDETLDIEDYDADWDEDDYLYEGSYEYDGNQLVTDDSDYDFEFKLSDDKNMLTLEIDGESYQFIRGDFPEKEEATGTTIEEVEEEETYGDEDWDEILDDYEDYVDDYISLLKKYNSGDMDAMTEYMEMMENAEELSEKLDNASDDLSSDQLGRFMEIQEKMTNAALELMEDAETYSF